MPRSADRRPYHESRGVCQVLCSTRGIGGLLASGTRFFPSHPSIYQCLLHLSMSGTSILAGAHNPVLSGGTINAAGTVRETVRLLWNELTAWISCRSTTTTATKRYLMQPFPFFRTRALDSQVGQRLLQSSRIIFLLIPMTGFKRESTFYYMEWGVLERLKFA